MADTLEVTSDGRLLAASLGAEPTETKVLADTEVKMAQVVFETSHALVASDREKGMARLVIEAAHDAAGVLIAAPLIPAICLVRLAVIACDCPSSWFCSEDVPVE